MNPAIGFRIRPESCSLFCSRRSVSDATLRTAKRLQLAFRTRIAEKHFPGTQRVAAPSLHVLPHHPGVPSEPILASDRLGTGHQLFSWRVSGRSSASETAPGVRGSVPSHSGRRTVDSLRRRLRGLRRILRPHGADGDRRVRKWVAIVALWVGSTPRG